MTDPISKARADVTAEIVKAVREEIRMEMIMAGVVDSSWHVAPEDRVALAARLRRMANELDPPERLKRVGGRPVTDEDVRDIAMGIRKALPWELAVLKRERGEKLDQNELMLLGELSEDPEDGTVEVSPPDNDFGPVLYDELREEPPQQKTNGASKVPKFGQPVGPTADDPFRDLKFLPKVAICGRDNLLKLAAEPITYVWVDIIVEGDIALMSGAPGEGKTTLAFLVLLARANKGKAVSLLGHRVEPAPSGTFQVLIEGEHGGGGTARKLVKSAKIMNVDDSALDRIIVIARKAVLIGSPEWGDIVRLIRAGLVSDVILDTLARVSRADADNEGEQAAIFNQIAVAIESAPEGTPRPTAWVLTHNRKGATGTLADVSGSTQRAAQADAVLMIDAERVGGKVVSSKVTFMKLREPPDDDYPKPTTFIIGKDASGEPCLSTTEVNNPDEDDRPLEARITDILRGGPQTKAALAKILGRSWKAVDDAITALFAARAIRTGTPKTIRGRDYPTFELRDGFETPKTTHPADEFNDMFDDGDAGI